MVLMDADAALRFRQFWIQYLFAILSTSSYEYNIEIYVDDFSIFSSGSEVFEHVAIRIWPSPELKTWVGDVGLLLCLFQTTIPDLVWKKFSKFSLLSDKSSWSEWFTHLFIVASLCHFD